MLKINSGAKSRNNTPCPNYNAYVTINRAACWKLSRLSWGSRRGHTLNWFGNIIWDKLVFQWVRFTTVPNSGPHFFLPFTCGGHDIASLPSPRRYYMNSPCSQQHYAEWVEPWQSIELRENCDALSTCWGLKQTMASLCPRGKCNFV